MICKYCKRDIEDDSIFCRFCGERAVRKRVKKLQDKRYPKHRTLADGSLLGQIMIEGQRQSVKASSEDEYKAKIDALRAGVIKGRNTPSLSVGKAIDRFIESNSNTLSPATIRAYKSYRRSHYKKVIDRDIYSEIDWQSLMNEEAASVAPKTVENLWRLITGTMRSLKITPPEINLPAVPGVDTAWLNYKQVMVFVDAVRNKPCELYALLALHSLRLSEIMALTPARVDFEKEQIKVAGARVMGEEGVVEKKTNKTRKSRRPVPIMIPRLLEILPREGDDYLVKSKPNNLHLRINTVCRQAGLPEVGVQGLRRSFASLAYHLGWNERTTMEIGGWTNPATVHRFYIKLAEEDINKRAEAMKNFYSQGSKITTEITTKT